MGKILVFIYDNMADFEITFVTHLLGGDLGKEIVTVGYEDNIITSKSGIMYKPSKTIKDALKDEVEGLIIPGGWNGEVREELVELIQSVNIKDNLLGAICAGPRFLAKAGVLNDVKYTTSLVNWNETHIQNFKEEDLFPRQNFIVDRVVRDKNVITAQGYAFIDFAIEILDYFGGFEDEEDKNSFIKITKGI